MFQPLVQSPLWILIIYTLKYILKLFLLLYFLQKDEKNTYSQNFELENVVSLWDWDFLNLFKKIELKEYIVMEKVGDNLKLKDKRSSSIYELSLLQVNYENLSKLAFLWSKVLF